MASAALLERLAEARALLHRPRGPLPVLIHEDERPRPAPIQNSECPAPGMVAMVPVEAIAVRPELFQFRVANTPAGTCGRLQAVPHWNQALAGALLLWRDPDGELNLIDGHHRLELARRDGITEVAALLIEAADPREARLLGAIANLAAGQAEAPELARLLRDQPDLTPAAVSRLYGVARQAKPLSDAARLRRLEDGLFSRCCNGELELELALALAAASDHLLQLRLWQMASQRNWSAPQTLEAAHLAQLVPAGPAEVPDGVLPGFEELLKESNTLLDQQLLVRSEVRKLLRIENRTAKIVGHHRAAAVLERRNVATVDQQAALEVRAESSALLERFSALCGYSGPLSALLTELAKLVADGGDATRVVEVHMDRIREVLAQALT